MPSRLWPNPTPRAAVSSAFAISPRQCVDLFTVLFALRPHPVYYPVRFEPAGPTAQDLRRRHYIALCLRSRQACTTICALRARMFRGDIVTFGSPSTTRFVSPVPFLSPYLWASGAGNRRPRVERD